MAPSIQQLSIGLRIRQQDAGHTHLDVFVGSTLFDTATFDPVDITRGYSGSLTLRTPEFDAFVGALQATAGLAADVHVDVYRDLAVPHPCLDDTEYAGFQDQVASG